MEHSQFDKPENKFSTIFVPIKLHLRQGAQLSIHFVIKESQKCYTCLRAHYWEDRAKRTGQNSNPRPLGYEAFSQPLWNSRWPQKSAWADIFKETGRVEMEAPETRFQVESPGGLISVVAECNGSTVIKVTLESMPSFVAYTNKMVIWLV